MFFSIYLYIIIFLFLSCNESNESSLSFNLLNNSFICTYFSLIKLNKITEFIKLSF